MKLPVVLSSTVFIAVAILGINHLAYGQCQGGYCPIPSPYFNPNAASKYGYDKPNEQNNRNSNVQGNQNPNWQGNQNPNWQGNQTPNRRNDQGWRDYNTQSTNYQTPSNTYYQHISENEVARQKTGADRLLQHKIEDALKNNYLRKNYSFVTTRVYNGNVTLSGTVESENDRQDVENRVRNIPGVRDVNDQIKIGIVQEDTGNEMYYMEETDTGHPAADQTLTLDKDIQKQAEDALKNNYVKKNFELVIVTVNDGIVTITGTIEGEADRQEIRDRLLKIRGIRSIVDRLQTTGDKASYSYRKPAYAR